MNHSLSFSIHILLVLCTQYRHCLGTKVFGSTLEKTHHDTLDLSKACTYGPSGSTIERPVRGAFQIADIHGDFEQLRRLLYKLHLIDSNNSWTGGDAIVVFTGDYVDRGLDSVKVLKTLESLKAQATGTGGRIITLKGNHELMITTKQYNDMGTTDAQAYVKNELCPSSEPWLSICWHARVNGMDVTYNSDGCPSQPNDALRKALDSVLHREKATKGQTLSIIQSMPIFTVLRFKHEAVLFLHVGMTKTLLDQIDISCAAAPDFVKCAEGALREDPHLEKTALWDRSIATGTELEQDLAATLQRFNVDRMVLGHSVVQQHGNEVHKYNGRVVLTDHAMSRGIYICLRDDYNTFNEKSKGALPPVHALYFSPEGRSIHLAEKSSKTDRAEPSTDFLNAFEQQLLPPVSNT